MSLEKSKANEIEERLINFATNIIGLTNSLPRNNSGKHVAGQILRSGTSPAPNYGEARGAESNADFVHKLGVVLKELNETSIWLRIIKNSKLLKGNLLDSLIEENSQLGRIINASIKTVRRRNKK